MAFFKDEQEVYQFIGKLFQDLAVDEVLFPQFQKANTVVQFPFKSPKSQITLKIKEGQAGQVDLGPTELVPEVVMTMDADIAHRFWLGQVNVTVALAPRPDEGQGSGRQDPQAPAADEDRVPSLQAPARAGRASRPDRLMPGDPAGRQMAGLKPFYQFLAPTRVIAGRDLLGSVGGEFGREGAKRVLIVTDEVIRATGLVDRVDNGVVDGGLEVAGIFDGVPQDSDSAVVAAVAASGPRASAPTRSSP